MPALRTTSLGQPWRIGLALALLTLSLSACGDHDDVTGGSEVPLPATLEVPPPEPDDCITDTTTERQSLTCEGLSFELSVPAVCRERACGLIVDVHGFGMSGPTQDLHTELGRIGADAGFIILQPSAPLDPGSGGFASWSSRGDHDDQVFAILNRVRRVFHVQDARIHMTGYSQGGSMTWRFLCAHPGLFGSVAPLAFGGGTCFGEAPPDEGVDVLYAHGTTDGLASFAAAITTVEGILDRWELDEGEIVSQDDAHTWTRYVSDRGTRFEFLEFDWETGFVLGTTALRAHCFPGSDQFVGCGSDTPVHWGEEITRFFLAHPRP